MTKADKTLANRMGSLVDDLLAFSRIGRAETQKTTVHLEQLVKGVVGEIARNIFFLRKRKLGAQARLLLDVADIQ